MGIELGFAFRKARVRESKRDGIRLRRVFAVVALRIMSGARIAATETDETVWASTRGPRHVRTRGRGAMLEAKNDIENLSGRVNVEPV